LDSLLFFAASFVRDANLGGASINSRTESHGLKSGFSVFDLGLVSDVKLNLAMRCSFSNAWLGLADRSRTVGKAAL
jgi:hypothetical protein